MTQSLRLQGIRVSLGIGIGVASCVTREGEGVPRYVIKHPHIPREVERLHRAAEESRREIAMLRETLPDVSDDAQRLILDAHLMMHSDKMLVQRAADIVRREGVNAQWALHQALDQVLTPLRHATHAYMRERAIDVEHVGAHMMAFLRGNTRRLPPLNEGSVLVAWYLSPLEMMRLQVTRVQAVVMAAGSYTCHSAIIARALNIPVLMGVDALRDHVQDDDSLIVDALRGELILRPSPQEVKQSTRRAEEYRSQLSNLGERSQSLSPQTHDGCAIELWANVEMPAEIPTVREVKAVGIGLYRTEFLQAQHKSNFDEEKQYQAYANIVQAMQGAPITFRTLDRLDIPPSTPMGALSNNWVTHIGHPSLGLRALRASLAQPEVFCMQLRALIRAAAHGDVRVMFPLVTTVEELRAAKGWLAQSEAQLCERGIPVGQVQVGIMLELPAAVLMADVLLAECDFAAVGTNDLMQYTFAADRTEARVAHLSNPAHPALLKLMHGLQCSAAAKTKPIFVCGDMAADPLGVLLLLGLGYHRLSLPASSIPWVRGMLRHASLQSLRELVGEALACATAEEVKALLYQRCAAVLGEVPGIS